ncbi:MAG: hypothetical protein ACOH1T_00535 [Microbacteriaceae bacterium]
MDDMAKDLPLSQRQRRDESAVTANWAQHRSTLLYALAEMLDELAPADWELPTLRSDVSVRITVGELVWLTSGSARQRAATVARRMLRDRSRPAAASRAIAQQFARESPNLLGEKLRVHAARDLSSGAHESIATLTPAVVAAFELSAATGRTITVDPIASGAVAVARSLTAPSAIRAVVTARTFHASDAGWQVGNGPEFVGTAAAIVLFLHGRAPLPSD